MSRRSLSPCMNTKPGMWGTPWAAKRSWYSDGDTPTSWRNRLLNDPRLLNPTSMHTSVTVRLVARSRSCARSMRRSER
jgi:hypothetical protein